MHINILDAKNRLSQLVKLAQAGEEVVIANRGRPVARLVAAGGPASAALRGAPLASQGGPAGGGLADWLAANPLPAHARRSAAEIDDAIAQERGGWD